MKSDKYLQGVIDAIDPKYFGENNRFANGFYVTEKGEVAIAKLSYHGEMQQKLNYTIRIQ